MANPVSQFQLTDLFNMTNFNSKITDTNTYIETLVEEAKQSGVKIATGSYVGTGTYGAYNPCSLTFDFAPRFVVVLGFNLAYKATLFVYNCTQSSPYNASDTTDNKITVEWQQNTIVWSNTYSSASYQLNSSGTTYYYIAIG